MPTRDLRSPMRHLCPHAVSIANVVGLAQGDGATESNALHRWRPRGVALNEWLEGFVMPRYVDLEKLVRQSGMQESPQLYELLRQCQLEATLVDTEACATLCELCADYFELLGGDADADELQASACRKCASKIRARLQGSGWHPLD